MQNYTKEVSLPPKKGKMQMQLCVTDRLKSICTFNEEQVADTLDLKRASATANIKAMQIHPLSKKHLQQQISSICRYPGNKKNFTGQTLENYNSDFIQFLVSDFYLFTTCAVTRFSKIIIYGLRANLERVLEVVGELIFALRKLNEHV